MFAAILMVAPATAANLTVDLEGVHVGAGKIRVVLYSKPEDFRHEDRATQILSAPATKEAVTVTFEGLAPGRYAIMTYHDANDNQKLDLRLGMFPKEGWGLSNNPHIMGPPSFSASAIEVPATGTKATIELHY